MGVVLVAVVAIAAAVPLWACGGRGPGALLARLLLSVGAVAVVVAAALRERPAAEPPAERPLVAAEGDYVGSANCRSCHPAEHASWHGSFHRTMTQVATRASLVPQFERLELDWFGAPVVLAWRGDTLWATFHRGGAAPTDVDRPVEQLTGSHHLQVLWYSTGKGRELAPVPMCFKIEEGIWLPLTTVFVLPPEFRDPPEPGTWSQSCTMCHATAPRPRIDVDRNDTHVAELGIACEACHGPGARHVAANRNPLRRYAARAAGADDTIVNPATLPPARSAQVCGHCHAVSILRQEHFDRWREAGSPFVPGRELAATHLLIGPGDRDAPELRRELQRNPHFFASSFWSDGQVRLTGREFSGLRQSPCYVHGDPARQIDCTSCHRLHADDGVVDDAWRDDQLRPEAHDNRACTQCHERFVDGAALAAHTHHAPTSSGSACYACHMPFTSFGLMKAERSHTITSPDVATELATGRPNACNLCHLDRSLQWTVERLQADWGRALPPLDADQREVAAAVRWLMTGDAGQRALAAWAFGRPEAQAVAGSDWLAPYLARLLDDPYYVVRFGAARSLRSLPDGAAALTGYDFLAAPGTARTHVERVQQRWRSGYRGAARPALLVDERGLVQTAFDRLYARRDDRPVYLAE